MKFKGFRPRQKLEQYTGIPNEVFDEIMSKVSGNQFKILMAIFRKTYGWVDGSDGNGNATYKVEDEISQSQLMEMTGISKNTVKKHITKLIEKGLILKVEDYERGVNKATKYRVKQNRGSNIDTRNGERGSNIDTRRGSNFDPTKESKKKVVSKEPNNSATNLELEKLKNHICNKVNRTSLIGEESLSESFDENGADLIKEALKLAIKKQKERQGYVNINSYKYILKFIDEVENEKDKYKRFSDRTVSDYDYSEVADLWK